MDFVLFYREFKCEIYSTYIDIIALYPKRWFGENLRNRILLSFASHLARVVLTDRGQTVNCQRVVGSQGTQTRSSENRLRFLQTGDHCLERRWQTLWSPWRCREWSWWRASSSRRTGTPAGGSPPPGAAASPPLANKSHRGHYLSIQSLEMQTPSSFYLTGVDIIPCSSGNL